MRVGLQRVKQLTLFIGLPILLCLTAAVFLAFDRTSHSASDTLRPFVISMAPVWLVGILAARALLR